MLSFRATCADEFLFGSDPAPRSHVAEPNVDERSNVLPCWPDDQATRVLIQGLDISRPMSAVIVNAARRSWACCCRPVFGMRFGCVAAAVRCSAGALMGASSTWLLAAPSPAATSSTLVPGRAEHPARWTLKEPRRARTRLWRESLGRARRDQLTATRQWADIYEYAFSPRPRRCCEPAAGGRRARHRAALTWAPHSFDLWRAPLDFAGRFPRRRSAIPVAIRPCHLVWRVVTPSLDRRRAANATCQDHPQLGLLVAGLARRRPERAPGGGGVGRRRTANHVNGHSNRHRAACSLSARGPHVLTRPAKGVQLLRPCGSSRSSA
jgi:hypothetical protein